MIEKKREMDEKETQIVLKTMYNEIFMRIQNIFLVILRFWAIKKQFRKSIKHKKKIGVNQSFSCCKQ